MWNLILGPKILYKKIRAIKYPFIVLFADMIKSTINQGYLVWIKALYKRDFLNKLKLLAKNVRFLYICKHIVQGEFEFDHSNNKLKNLQVKARTVIVLTQTLARIKKLIKAKSFIKIIDESARCLSPGNFKQQIRETLKDK